MIVTNKILNTRHQQIRFYDKQIKLNFKFLLILKKCYETNSNLFAFNFRYCLS